MGNTNVLLDSKAQEIMKDVYNLGGGTTVVANPTITGAEEELSSITIGNENYTVSRFLKVLMIDDVDGKPTQLTEDQMEKIISGWTIVCFMNDPAYYVETNKSGKNTRFSTPVSYEGTTAYVDTMTVNRSGEVTYSRIEWTITIAS